MSRIPRLRDCRYFPVSFFHASSSVARTLSRYPIFTIHIINLYINDGRKMCKQYDRKTIRQVSVIILININVLCIYLVHNEGTARNDEDETLVCHEGDVPRANF